MIDWCCPVWLKPVWLPVCPACATPCASSGQGIWGMQRAMKRPQAPLFAVYEGVLMDALSVWLSVLDWQRPSVGAGRDFGPERELNISRNAEWPAGEKRLVMRNENRRKTFSV
ncbi:hypothetical protein SRHO_G00223980 [Serrasalmus rhombeus]